MAGTWASLFSGGKDSSWALYRAQQSDLEVSHLVTVHPSPDSYMYHVPATELTALAAESIGLPLVEIDPASFDAESAVDAGEQGDEELVPLEAALRDLVADTGLAGVTAGAIESEYQTSRIEAMCDRLGIDLFAPLWNGAPFELARDMLEAGFDIRIVQVAAEGLDESWLGRRLDSAALSDIRALESEYGVHPLGEGGEFETLVVDGPHMDRRIELEYTTTWQGTRGHIEIQDAWLTA